MSALTLPSGAIATGSACAVQTVGVSKVIDDRPILQDISLEICTGQFVALLGANGAGKSTLLKILSTLIPPTGGKLHLFGKSPRQDASVRARIGLISHQSLLYRDLTARQNLDFFARLYGVEHRASRVEALLKLVRLEDRAGDAVKAFSRGMVQRLSIARALVQNPDLLLADEPFDGLDAPSAADLEELLKALQRSGKTIIMANHDISQSLRLADRTVVLNRGAVTLDRPSHLLEEKQVLSEMRTL